MKTPPTVSVVLASNRGPDNPFLAETVRSVARQTLTDIELVVVDDGSPHPIDRATLPGAPAGTTFLRIGPSGPSAARNAGARVASGELLAFLDDDDVWEHGRLAAHATAMQGDPALVLTYCRMRSIDADGREIAPPDQAAVTSTADVFRRRTGIILPNSVVRASAFRAADGFDESRRLAEDLDLVLRLAARGPVARVGDGSLVSYRRHDDNATGRHRALAAAIREVVADHRTAALRNGQDELVDALDESQAANDRYAAWAAGRAARTAMARGRPGVAVGEILWALRFAPSAPGQWLLKRLARRDRPPAAAGSA
ncbi:glycosyltransferase family 2 protein [Isoptericola croceus]|uniref:glycosyltransferase family 2 protein n=1 Tax=Isoptericola croceus TaxID=3031406 RepID=UPI0023F71191|nr:glycosyltransferase family A protein [Isoptericola croceus]